MQEVITLAVFVPPRWRPIPALPALPFWAGLCLMSISSSGADRPLHSWPVTAVTTDEGEGCCSANCCRARAISSSCSTSTARTSSRVRALHPVIQNYADPTCAKLRRRGGQRRAQRRPVTAEVNRLLHKTFITPIDREQIHGLINAMDDILDLLQDASETMSLYDVRAMTEEVLRLGDLSVRAASACSTPSRCWSGMKAARGGDEDLRGDRQARIRRRPRDARRDVAPVPRGDRRARADQAQGDLRAARVDLRPLRGTSPT